MAEGARQAIMVENQMATALLEKAVALSFLGDIVNGDVIIRKAPNLARSFQVKVQDSNAFESVGRNGQ